MTKPANSDRIPPQDDEIPDWHNSPQDWRTMPIDEIMHRRFIDERPYQN